MLGVSAMTVQNAPVPISLKGTPSTAVMMSNVTRFALDAGEVLLWGAPADVVAGFGGQPRVARLCHGICG